MPAEGDDVTDETNAVQLAEAFTRDGVVRVRQVLDAAELVEAAAAIEAVLAEPSPLALVASGPDDPGSFTEDFRRWQDVPAIERLARHSRVPAIAAALMRTTITCWSRRAERGSARHGTRISPTTTSTASE